MAHHYIPVVDALAAQCKASVHFTVCAVLNDHVMVGAVVWVFVCPCALASLHSHGIVVDAHIASVYEHVVANVNIDGIAAGCLDTRCGRIDIATYISNIFTLV